MIKEIWKDIKGYEGLYQVSNLGRVRIQRILLPWVTSKRAYVSLSDFKGHKQKYLVHRLVADAFIPNPEGKPFVDHIDTNSLNNVATNLRWVTQKENCNNPLTLEHYRKMNLKHSYKGDSVYYHASRLGLNVNTVRSRMRRGYTPEEALQIPVNVIRKDEL